MTLIPPRGGFGDVLFPSAKDVVLGLPLISTTRRRAGGYEKRVKYSLRVQETSFDRRRRRLRECTYGGVLVSLIFT